MSTQSQSNKSKRNRKRRQNQRTKRIAQPRVQKYYNVKQLHVGECTRTYVRALVNPFGYLAEQPCIPDTISIPSFKFSTKARGVLSTGVQGTGYILVDPFMMCANDLGVGPSGIDSPVVYTSAAYNQTGLLYNNDDTQPAGVFTAVSNSQFPYIGFFDNKERQIRLVGCGVRIKYIGSTFRNQGRVISFRVAGNASVLADSVNNAPTFLADNLNVTTNVNRAWDYVHYVPDNHVLLSYFQLSSLMITQGFANHRSYGFLIEGGDTEIPQSWEWEVTAHFEAVGPNMTYSPSHSDVTGFGGVLSALPLTVPTKQPMAEENSLWQRFASYFDSETTRYVLGQATNVVKSGAPVILNAAGGRILNQAAASVGRNIARSIM